MARLKCPVCGAFQASLEELNTHLDAEHPVDSGEPTSAELPMTDKTEWFKKRRKKQLDILAMRRTKLEIRLEKLLLGIQRILAPTTATSSAVSSNGGALNLAGAGFWNWREISAVRDFEQKVATWEDESVFERCRFCGQHFSFFLRKHHCRVCGLVTCGDVERECSLEVPSVLLAQKLLSSHGDSQGLRDVTTAYPIRVCTECRSTLFSVRNFEEERNSEPIRPLQYFDQLKKSEVHIEAMLPRFESLVYTLLKSKASSENGGDGSAVIRNEKDLRQIRKTRQELLRLFSQYDALTRRLRATPVETETENRLKNQIASRAVTYLETTMMPLSALPQSLSYNESTASSKAEASHLQNQLVVLEEQRFLLEQQIASAKRLRHFDVIGPLQLSLSELTDEVTSIQKQLGASAPSTT